MKLRICTVVLVGDFWQSAALMDCLVLGMQYKAMWRFHYSCHYSCTFQQCNIDSNIIQLMYKSTFISSRISLRHVRWFRAEASLVLLMEHREWTYFHWHIEYCSCLIYIPVVALSGYFFWLMLTGLLVLMNSMHISLFAKLFFFYCFSHLVPLYSSFWYQFVC